MQRAGTAFPPLFLLCDRMSDFRRARKLPLLLPARDESDNPDDNRGRDDNADDDGQDRQALIRLGVDLVIGYGFRRFGAGGQGLSISLISSV